MKEVIRFIFWLSIINLAFWGVLGLAILILSFARWDIEAWDNLFIDGHLMFAVRGIFLISLFFTVGIKMSKK